MFHDLQNSHDFVRLLVSDSIFGNPIPYASESDWLVCNSSQQINFNALEIGGTHIYRYSSSSSSHFRTTPVFPTSLSCDLKLKILTDLLIHNLVLVYSYWYCFVCHALLVFILLLSWRKSAMDIYAHKRVFYFCKCIISKLRVK